MEYSKEVMERYNNPKNVGALDDNDKNVGTSVVGAPACGDVIKFQMKVDENGKISEAKFKAFGCGAAIASSALITEWVRGKSLEEAEGIKNREVAEYLSLPPVKCHCSVLAEEAVRKAIKNYQGKNKKIEVEKMEKVVNFTDRAMVYMKKAVEEEGCLGIRINAVIGGCHGMTYELNFVKEAEPDDLVLQENDLTVYVAPSAVIFISGMTVDYVNSPMGGKIVFENPNAKSQCGCGKSFCVDDVPCGEACRF
jgi:nitrogen fixation NifU-like protein